MSAVRALLRNLEGYAREHNGEFPAIIELSEDRYYDILNEVQRDYPGLECTLFREQKIFGVSINIINRLIPEHRAFQPQVTEIQYHPQAQFDIRGVMTQRSQHFGSGGFVENPFRFHQIVSKSHPPYPLIGIEWEPQLTLLNYPKKKVDIRVLSSISEISTASKSKGNDACCLFLPEKYKKYVDVDNLEFRTKPVKFDDLKDEIKRVQDGMETVVKEIAKEVGPVGVFLPGDPCTKHVNISGIHHLGPSEIKEGEFGERIHIRVPYSYNDYMDIKSWSVFRDIFSQVHIKPILLGYSMTGETYERRSELI